MRVKSSAFHDEGTIPKKYTCTGDNVSPPLRIDDVPGNAAALALVMDDPDARGTFVHWTWWNLPIGHLQLGEGADVTKLGAVEGKTSFGKPGYGGPCPPSGTHRYFFKVYALEEKLNLTADSEIRALEKELKKHSLAWGELMGRFSKG